MNLEAERMDVLQRQIARARRRLLLQSFAVKVTQCCFVTLLAACLAIGLGKWWPVLDDRTWALASLGVALAVGLLAALLWTWAAAQSTFDAAVEIDRRFGLKERVSSVLALDPKTLDSPMGQALLRDAQRRVERIDVATAFGIRLSRRAWLPLAPIVLAGALSLGLSVRQPGTTVQAATQDTVQIKKSTDELRKRLAVQRKAAEERGLSEADALFKELDEQAKKLAERGDTDRTQALAALHELSHEAEKRREQLANQTDLKQQLSQLKNLQRGPAEKLGQALKNGDVAKALEALDKLKEQLDKGELSPQAKEALGQQMAQMQEALQKQVDAHQQAQEALREQIEAQRRAGNVAEADKLQQQLDQLEAQQPRMHQMRQMAEQMQEAANQLQQGDAKQAAQALGQMREQLEEMKEELSEMEMLDDALAEIAECKNAMACKKCQGEGCEACQDGKPGGQRNARTGIGHEPGTWPGTRDKELDPKFFDSQVKQKVGRGASIVTGLADGPNRKGQVRQEIQGQFSDAQQQTADALSDQKLPHDYRDHAKGYFDALREGKAPTAPPQATDAPSGEN